jgi:hypothetical protein
MYLSSLAEHLIEMRRIEAEKLANKALDVTVIPKNNWIL